MYHCAKCDYDTEIRRNIRQHVQEQHNIKGGRKTLKEIHADTKIGVPNVKRKPISKYYERTN